MSDIDNNHLLSFSDNILVAGATGATGKIIVERLCELGLSTRLFVRDKNLLKVSNKEGIILGPMYKKVFQDFDNLEYY